MSCRGGGKNRKKVKFIKMERAALRLLLQKKKSQVKEKAKNESDGRSVVGDCEHLFSPEKRDGIRKRKMRNKKTHFCATAATTTFEEEEERRVRASENESDSG